MDKRTFSPIISVILFKLLIVLLLSHFTYSAPVNSTMSYDAFLKNITEENCTFPNGIVLPFKEQATTLQFFSVPLKICKAPGAVKRSLEAIRLCIEIYDALRNITCQSNKNVQLPKIEIEFSDNVCQDISTLKIPHGLLQHLTDKFVCEMMCEDDFLPACKVLLWSFQIQKRIDDNSLVQSVQNTSDQQSINVNATLSNASKILVTPKQENPVLDEEQQLLEPVPKIDNPDFNNEIKDDRVMVNDNELLTNDKQMMVNNDTAKNDLGQTAEASNFEQNVKEENELQDEPKVKGNQLGEKQDQTLKLDEQNQFQVENEIINARKDSFEIKIKEPVPVIKNLTSEENKIDVDELPSKSSISSNSQKTNFKNNPAVSVPEQAKNTINKTEPKKAVTAQYNLPLNSSVAVKLINVTNTSKILKPVISGLNDNLNKSQEKVFPSPILPKISPDGATETKFSIKSEVTSPKSHEITDTNLIPTIGKEDAVSVTTFADLEKMEDEIPEPRDKEPDLYNEDRAYDSSKNKKIEENDSGKVVKPAENESPKYDVYPQRNSFRRGEDDGFPVPFPEQEDSHFFFYFLSLVLILMAGYLLFHNKQKILALIVEGRHERRRRSHGIGYKKLETK